MTFMFELEKKKKKKSKKGIIVLGISGLSWTLWVLSCRLLIKGRHQFHFKLDKDNEVSLELTPFIDCCMGCAASLYLL